MSCFFFCLRLIVGSPETNIDTDENRHEFTEKFQRLKQQVLEGVGQEKDDENQQAIIARTIFTSDISADSTITIGHWTLQCNGPKQLLIHNVESEQVRSKLNANKIISLFSNLNSIATEFSCCSFIKYLRKQNIYV